jgi:hypothetical protein
MKRRNWAFVTTVLSIHKPSTRTRCVGRSSARAFGSSLPIVNSPPGIHTIAGGLEEIAARLDQIEKPTQPAIAKTNTDPPANMIDERRIVRGK